VAHFVADLHQPLHVGREADRGGNDIRVTGSTGGDQNLHRYWDTTVITAVQPDPRSYARAVAPLAVGHVKFWQSTAPREWGRESFDLRPVVYDFESRSGAITLGPAYAERAETTARMRLAQAGVRLAGLLNQLLGQGGTGCAASNAAE
jgi:hypothetical protein